MRHIALVLCFATLAAIADEDRSQAAADAAALAKSYKGRGAVGTNPTQLFLSSLQEKANDQVARKNDQASADTKSTKNPVVDPAAAVKAAQDLFAAQTPITTTPPAETNITASGGASSSGSGSGQGGIAAQIAQYQQDIVKSNREITAAEAANADTQIVVLQNKTLVDIYTLKSSIQKQIQSEQSSLSRNGLEQKTETPQSAARQGQNLLRTTEQREEDTRKHSPYFATPINEALPVGR